MSELNDSTGHGDYEYRPEKLVPAGQTYIVNFVACERGITCHEEMTSRGGNQAGNDPNEVIVHVAWVS